MLLLSGCFSNSSSLAAFFERDLASEGRSTPARYMTDRTLSDETAGYLRDLSSRDEGRRKEAFRQLSQLKELIEFGLSWQMPAFELNPGLVVTKPVIDGKLGRNEWKSTIEIQGSCPAGRRRRYFDGSRLLFKYDKDFLYIGAYFPFTNGKQSKEDHAIVYFDIPGGSGWRYKECILSPEKGNTFMTWSYCGNGARERILPDSGEPQIQAASAVLQHGYSIELAIPRRLLKIHPDGCCRAGLLRWDPAIEDYRTPVAIPYHGHDLFNRLRLRLPE